MKLTKYLPYFGTIILFVIAALLYFNPVLSGKQIKQSDISQYIGMAKEMNNFRAEEKSEPYWIGNAFSGMPAYQVGARFPNDLIKELDYKLRFLPRPADYLFLYFIGFFLLMMALKVEWKLAVLGSLSFGFSTYLIIIFGAGHNAKAHAIAYMPAVLAGVLYVFQKRYLLGFIITAIAMALEIAANHIQMTYYLVFCLLILGIVEALEAFKTKSLPIFAKQVAIICVASFLGLGTNASRLLSTKEYADYSTRGKSELTINPDGTPKEKATGLDKSYITEYSYGKLETFNLIVPRFMGGGTVEELGPNSNFYKVLEENAGTSVAEDYSKQVLTYWGDQPIIEAPAYIGVVVFFLFILAIFLFEYTEKKVNIFSLKGVASLASIIFILVRLFLHSKDFPLATTLVEILIVLMLCFIIFNANNKFVKWLLASISLSILLSWGKNFPAITNFFIDYIPLYNKFRAVSSIQVIAELCIPILGILGLREFFTSKLTIEEKILRLKYAAITSGGIVILGFLLAHMSSTFEGLRDQQYRELPTLIEALISDRKSLLFNDSIRSIILIVFAGGVLWMFLKNKIQKLPVLLLLLVFVLFDLLTIDLNYVNKEDFTSARNVEKPFRANEADKKILKDTSHYRVANFSGNLMNEARTSYFHKSIGGYHAAKMMRYLELFEYQIAKNNLEALNMLNAKYFIGSETEVQENKEANGNAWFIRKLKVVDSANKEIKALDSLNTKVEAVIRKKDAENMQTSFEKDSLASIVLKSYKSNHLIYESKSSKDQFAVFSEIYYEDGWNAYIDDVLQPHYRVNYVLRGMKIPKGTHAITFKFEPQVIQQGNIISNIFYILIVLIPLGWFFFTKKSFNTKKSL